jgi:hypothetical protein
LQLIALPAADMVHPGEGIENCSYQGDREFPIAEKNGLAAATLPMAVQTS